MGLPVAKPCIYKIRNNVFIFQCNRKSVAIALLSIEKQMVIRRYLTPELVAHLEPPEVGERWVYDTKIPGFGVRIWRTRKAKIGQAFAIRTSDKNKQPYRATFDPWEDHLVDLSYFDREDFLEKATKWEFHNWTSIARRWAKFEIDRVKKGLPDFYTEIRAQQSWVAERFAGVSLEEAFNFMVLNSYFGKYHESKKDRLDHLFHTYVKRKYREIRISDIKGNIFWRDFSKSGISKSNARLLKPFLVNIAKEYGNLTQQHNELYKFGSDFSYFKLEDYASSEKNRDEFYEHFSEMIAAVERDETVASDCIWLYLASDLAPVTAVLSARWSDFFVRDVPKLVRSEKEPVSEIVIWDYSSKPFRHEAFRGIRKEALLRFRRRNTQKWPGTDWCFPSATSGGRDHIKTVAVKWEHMRQKRGLPDISLVQFRKRYKPRFWGLL